MNIRNFGIATGRLATDPVVFDNKDGSKKVKVKLGIQDNFKSGPDNTKQARFVEFDAFVSAENAKKGLGVYDMMHQGDLVSLQYTLQPNSYEKDGKTVYTTNLLVQSVDLLESRATTQARAAKKAAEAAAAGAEAPAAAPEAAAAGVADDQPFGE